MGPLVLIPDRKCVCLSPDKISSTNPRVIEDQRARQLCIDVRHSLFYETCATYGFNVDRVFSDGGCAGADPSGWIAWPTADGELLCFPAAQKIVAQRRQVALQACKSLPNSPSHSGGSTPGSASFPGQVAPVHQTFWGRCASDLPTVPLWTVGGADVGH